ncbi:hypothetical protein GGS23DRAFT_600508 [Durotheca rogersii]|uniref:uncharacterized protein n=1 Tax=Durotheca rogersii TaxID=419775 RepID=UPI0022207667|nr:uncharacterized protein GGS23DRAFT_600508 [Durotheca rogersii]KAI5859386.1 hypothetical protein GGS23DRAFT_600508 [Durotheca rogersii]
MGSGTQVYARSGRGGAGNFYSPQELAAAGQQDLEAQRPAAGDAYFSAPPAAAPAAGAYARSGRGGAGNFVPAGSTTGGSGVLMGRGGAGNWAALSSPAPAEGASQGEGAEAETGGEQQRHAALEAALPQLPPRIHYPHGPGRERRPNAPPPA